MPPLVHRAAPRGRYGRARLDPAAPLFVLRRIPAGVDGEGQPIALAPGAPFDASSVTKTRLGTLFRSRFIGHEPPRALRQAPAAEPAPTSPAPPAPIVEPPPPPASLVLEQPPAVVVPPPVPPAPAAAAPIAPAPSPVVAAPPVVAPVTPEPVAAAAPAPKPLPPRPFYGKRRGA